MPFIEALAQMPSYVKFLKEIITKRRRLEDFEMVALSEECSAIIQNKLPPKLKDPGSFSIPCTIGNSEFGKSLCDLGASINLMPYSIFKKLGLGELREANVTLQLADRSFKHPLGVVEDVLVKVGKFYFPVDFVVLEMEEDMEIPLILGRPFLATGGALIDVQDGKLTLRVGNEKEVFNVFKSVDNLSQAEICMRVDVVKTPKVEILKEVKVKPPIKSMRTCKVASKGSNESSPLSKMSVENKVKEPSDEEEKRKPDKRGKRKKEGCMIDETKEGNRGWVRMFYASPRVKKEGVFDEPNSTVLLREPT